MTQSGKFDFLLADNLQGEKHEQQFHQVEQFMEILCHGTMGHVQLYFKRKLKNDDGGTCFSTEHILFMIHTVPIRNENEETVLFLFNFKDLGHQPVGFETTVPGFGSNSNISSKTTIRSKNR